MLVSHGGMTVVSVNVTVAPVHKDLWDRQTGRQMETERGREGAFSLPAYSQQHGF